MMSVSKALSNASKCACGSTRKYIQCCGQYIKRGKLPTSAEALMRSRFTAYFLSDEAYLLNTWHVSTRPTELKLEDDKFTWNSLEVISTSAGKSQDKKGTVEFIASYTVQGKKQQINEVSRFVKDNNQWFYVDGVVE